MLLVLLGTAAGGLATYKHHYDSERDLSVIGNGTPAVVQVHDPHCPMCRRLRDNVDTVKPSYRDRIQFRIADIGTGPGRALASRHDVPHVTLLLFDGSGELLEVLSGVREPDSLRASFRDLL